MLGAVVTSVEVRCHTDATPRPWQGGCGVLGMRKTLAPPRNKRAALVTVTPREGGISRADLWLQQQDDAPEAASQVVVPLGQRLTRRALGT